MAQCLALQRLSEGEREARNGFVCGGGCVRVQRQQSLPAQ